MRRLNRRWTLPIAVVLALCFSGLQVASHLVDLVVVLGTARDMLGTIGADRINARLTILNQRIKALVVPVEDQITHVQNVVARGDFDNGENRQAVRHFLSGALAATPQVEGIGLLHPDLTVELFGRRAPEYLQESWRGRPAPERAMAWSRTATQGRWADPTLSQLNPSSVVMTYRAPLHSPTGHMGLVAAAVSVEGLSRFADELTKETGDTVFILYGRDHVLAHPTLVDSWPGVSAEQPLPRLDQVGDPVVAAFWDEARRPPRDMASRLNGEAGIVWVEGRPHTILYRVTEVDGHAFYLATHMPGMIIEDELADLMRAVAIGLLVLVAGVVAAVLLGRVISRPVLGLAETADQLKTREIEDVRPLPMTRLREVNSAATAFNQMLGALRERQRIRDLFGRYVSPAVVDRLLKDPEAALLGGRRRDVSLLFTDIAGFTSLSEEWPPETVVPLLNEYLEQICRLVAEQNGVVVDFIGDGVFALFGAPVPETDHAARALAAAAAIDAFATAFSARAEAKGIPFGLTRIGLNAGPAIVGNFGSVERLKYGAAGDTVNTASRLEGVNRLFGTHQVASRPIVEAVPGCVARPLAHLQLRGRREPLDVFEPLPADAAGSGWLLQYRAAYVLLGGGDRVPALAAFSALRQERPEDPVIRFHCTRLEAGVCSCSVTYDGK